MLETLAMAILRRALPALVGALAAFVATQYPDIYNMVCGAPYDGGLY